MVLTIASHVASGCLAAGGNNPLGICRVMRLAENYAT